MPCFQKIKEGKKVPDKCPYCGHRVVDKHCHACEGKGKKKKKVPAMVYS